MAEKKKSSRALTSALAGLERRYGEKVVMKMSDANTDADTFSSGRPDLDMILGGGYGVGKIIEVFAESGVGKTGLALEAVAAIQKLGGKAAIIDAEHALNTEYCKQLGIDIDELYICQPSSGEQAFEVIRVLINTGEIDLVMVDSVAALVPMAELDGEIGEQKIALQARMMSKGCKLIAGAASEVGCTVMFVNQLRKTIAQYGPSEVTSGGKALKFYATQRLELRNKGWIKEGQENIIGFKQQIKIVKNKIGVPFKIILNDIIYGKGIDDLTGLVEACIKYGILEKKGSYISYNGSNLAQGMKKLRIVLEDHEELVEELKQKLNEK